MVGYRLSMASLMKLIQREDGKLVEYALLCIFIVVVCVAAMTALGNRVSSRFSSAESGIAG